MHDLTVDERMVINSCIAELIAKTGDWQSHCATIIRLVHPLFTNGFDRVFDISRNSQSSDESIEGCANTGHIVQLEDKIPGQRRHIIPFNSLSAGSWKLSRSPCLTSWAILIDYFMADSVQSELGRERYVLGYRYYTNTPLYFAEVHKHTTVLPMIGFSLIFHCETCELMYKHFGWFETYFGLGVGIRQW